MVLKMIDVDDSAWKEFKKLCHSQDKTIKQELKIFLVDYINKNKE